MSGNVQDSEDVARTGDPPLWHRFSKGIFLITVSVTSLMTIAVTGIMLSQMTNPSPETMNVLDTAFSAMAIVSTLGFVIGAVEIIGPRLVDQKVRAKAREVLD